jgi:hypothetical protein
MMRCFPLQLRPRCTKPRVPSVGRGRVLTLAKLAGSDEDVESTGASLLLPTCLPRLSLFPNSLLGGPPITHTTWMRVALAR